MRKKFKKCGIDEVYLSEILGRKVVDFRVEEVKKGARLRADLFRFYVDYENGGKTTLFVKDFWYGSNISGDVVNLTLSEKSEVLDKNELDFLIFGTKVGAFTPRYFGHRSYENSNTDLCNIVFLENYDFSSEDKYLEIGEKKRATSNEKEKARLEKLAFDYVRRSIDIALIDNHLTNQSYRTQDSVGLPTVYKLEEEKLISDLIIYLNGLILFKFKQEKPVEERTIEGVTRDALSWVREYNYPAIFDTLVEFVVKPLARNAEERGLVNLDLHPAQVLLKEGSLPEYDYNAILALREGRKGPTMYDGFAITDNNKIGFGSSATIASLINHASVFEILPKDRLEQLAEHILIQQEQLEQGKIIHSEDIDPKVRRDFDEEYAAASRLACLRSMSYVSWLNLKHPEKAKEVEAQQPFYNPVRFINSTIDHFISLDDRLTEYFEKVNNGLSALKP